MILALALLAACTAPAARPMLSREAKVLDLPLVEQDQLYACGLVSITSLCRYWNTPIPESERARLAQLAAQSEGLSGGEVRAALDGLGFETYLFHGTLDHAATGLLAQVDAHRPTLVMLSPEPQKRHFVLFIGYDALERNACLLDPVRGRVLVPYEAFESSWRGCEHFTLLAVPARESRLVDAERKDTRS